MPTTHYFPKLLLISPGIILVAIESFLSTTFNLRSVEKLLTGRSTERVDNTTKTPNLILEFRRTFNSASRDYFTNER